MGYALFLRPALGALSCLVLASCGGGDGAAPAPAPGIGFVGGTPTPTPTPSPTPGNPPATNLVPPAPFGLTASADFALVGWQETPQGSGVSASLALAEHKGALAWSEGLKTYTIALSDLGSGRLVYTFPPSGNNFVAFSIVQADGSIAKAYVTLRPKTANLGEMFWQTADGVTPFIYARAIFGIPLAAGSLPASGRRVFTTDTSPQSSLVVDFATRKVGGTVTTFHDGGGWDPEGPKEQATLEPADIQPDGTFVAAFSVPGVPAKGELRGRLFGASGTDLAVYWNGQVRNGSGALDDWRAVMTYPVCTSCPG